MVCKIANQIKRYKVNLCIFMFLVRQLVAVFHNGTVTVLIVMACVNAQLRPPSVRSLQFVSVVMALTGCYSILRLMYCNRSRILRHCNQGVRYETAGLLVSC